MHFKARAHALRCCEWRPTAQQLHKTKMEEAHDRHPPHHACRRHRRRRRVQRRAHAAPKTFVLVHGAWHGGWCWRRVADVLEL
jgi:hypothetical protein